MEQKEKVSIIIPVYNVEKYIKRCIDSVIEQTYSNIEILLIDDGSSDLSGKICNDYLKKENRIKVFHKNNGGLSDARNFGIEKATGEYYSFIDSDDKVDKDFIKILIENLKTSEADISCCKMKKFTNEIDTIKLENKINTFTGHEALKNMLYQQNIDSSVCNKIFKKCIFKNIRFPVGKYFEDLGTTYKLLYNSNKVVVSNSELYFYYQRESSIIHKKNEKRIDDLQYNLNEIEKYINSNSKNLDLKKAFLARKIDANFYIHRESQKKLTREISKNYIYAMKKAVLSDNNISKKTRTALILSSFGIDFVDFLYRLKKS